MLDGSNGHSHQRALFRVPKSRCRSLLRYLATSLLLADNHDMVRMIVNSVKTDISSGNEVGANLWARSFEGELGRE